MCSRILFTVPPRFTEVQVKHHLLAAKLPQVLTALKFAEWVRLNEGAKQRSAANLPPSDEWLAALAAFQGFQKVSQDG